MEQQLIAKFTSKVEDKDQLEPPKKRTKDITQEEKDVQQQGVKPDNEDKESVNSEYQMISDIFVYDELRDQENFVIKKYKNAVFKGQINLETKKRQGFGVCITDSGKVYEGMWMGDKKNGQGFEIYKNQGTYRGNFKDNKPNGKGIYTYSNGEIYDGEWASGKKTGFGIWKGLFNDSYMGEWLNNLVHGFGVHQWTNGDRYEGQWQNSLKNGQGTDTFANQDIYSGHYKDGKPDGYGSYRWLSGAIYVGEFTAGMKNGNGQWKKDEKNPKSNQYSGEYKDDKKHGQGTFQWESGNVYKGTYENDLRHGYGEMFWIDGSVYKGDWKYGVQHGIGTITFSDGKTKQGKFENNTYIGKITDNILVKDMLPPIKEDKEEDMARSRASPFLKKLGLQQKLEIPKTPEPEQKKSMEIQTNAIPIEMKEKQIQTSKVQVIKKIKLKEKCLQTLDLTEKPKKMKDQIIQVVKQQQRSIITQTPAERKFVNEQQQTTIVVEDNDAQTSVLKNEIKIQTESFDYQDKGFDTDEKEIEELEKKLKMVSDVDSANEKDNFLDELVVFDEKDLEIKPLEPLKPLAQLKSTLKPIVVKQPELKPPPVIKRPQRIYQPELSNAKVNTSLVMPGSSSFRNYDDMYKQKQVHQSIDNVDAFFNKSKLGELNLRRQFQPDLNDMIIQPVVALEIKQKTMQQSIVSSSVNTPFLPVIVPKQPLTQHPLEDLDTHSETSTTNIDQMRRASKRAINLLLKNMKKKQASVWVPSGRQNKQTKVFHKNYSPV